MLGWNYVLFQLAMADVQVLTTTWKQKTRYTNFLLRQQCRHLV